MVLYPHICSLALKTTANPRRALDLHINASLEFLRLISPGKTSAISHAFPDEKLLMEEVNLLEQIPTIQKHMPSEKWTAARLKIRHEWLYRMVPRTGKKMLLRRQGVTVQGPGDEVWLHTKPCDDDLEEYLAKKTGRSEEGAKKEVHRATGGMSKQEEGEHLTRGAHGRDDGEGEEQWEDDEAGTDKSREHAASETTQVSGSETTKFEGQNAEDIGPVKGRNGVRKVNGYGPEEMANLVNKYVPKDQQTHDWAGDVAGEKEGG